MKTNIKVESGKTEVWDVLVTVRGRQQVQGTVDKAHIRDLSGDCTLINHRWVQPKQAQRGHVLTDILVALVIIGAIVLAGSIAVRIWN